MLVFMGAHFKRHQSVILRKLLCLYSRHGRSTFHLPDEAACLNSRFHLLHHLHIISIHFSACDCLLSRHISPTPWLLCLRSLCESICLAADMFLSCFFSPSFPIALIPFTQHTLAVWCKSVMKLWETTIWCPDLMGYSREIDKKNHHEYLSHLSDCIVRVISFFCNDWLSLPATMSHS